MGSIHFESGSDEIKPTSKRFLAETARLMKKHQKIHILVEGHTDNNGGARANLQLSERRAQAVRKFLVAKGVARDRVGAKGYGEAQPKASNETSAGRAQNRRIEIKVSN